MGVEGELCSAKALCLTLTQCSQGILLLVSTTDAQQHDICFKSGSSVIWVVSSNHLHRYSNACCSCFFPWHFVFLELAKKVGTWTQMHRKHTHMRINHLWWGSSVWPELCFFVLIWWLWEALWKWSIRPQKSLFHTAPPYSCSLCMLQSMQLLMQGVLGLGETCWWWLWCLG